MVVCCSQENHAENFFAEMSVKDGATYDALILGLVKVKEISIYVGVCVMYCTCFSS